MPLAAFEASDAWHQMEPALVPEGQPLVASYQNVLLRSTSFSMDIEDSLGASEPGVLEERIYYAASSRAHARNLKRTGDVARPCAYRQNVANGTGRVCCRRVAI